jgi:hypothetical protein
MLLYQPLCRCKQRACCISKHDGWVGIRCVLVASSRLGGKDNTKSQKWIFVLVWHQSQNVTTDNVFWSLLFKAPDICRNCTVVRSTEYKIVIRSDGWYLYCGWYWSIIQVL